MQTLSLFLGLVFEIPSKYEKHYTLHWIFFVQFSRYIFYSSQIHVKINEIRHLTKHYFNFAVV